MNSLRCLCFLLTCFCYAGCTGDSSPEKNAPSSHESPPPATNRIDLPPTVRKNLGITFAKVEARRVGQTIRVPGRFEPAPQARREHRTMFAGRVDLHVAQYQSVEKGSLLFTLDSPQWRELQQELNETKSKLIKASARFEASGPLMAAHERHHDELEKAVAIWTDRVSQLEKNRTSGVITDEEFARVRSTLATTRADLAEVLEKEAEIQAQNSEALADRTAARERLEILLTKASSLLGIPVKTLTSVDQLSEHDHPAWREIKWIEVRAQDPGVVESIAVTNGAWAAETSLVMTTVQPEILRFRAMGLQSDLLKFANNVRTRIVPPQSPAFDITEGVEATLTIGLEAHPDERTITLIATPSSQKPWMRAGVSAFLEIVVDSSDGPALAVPRSAIVKDGITHVLFRRDPADPNKAIRLEADMGVDDGRWVVIQSGLGLGDEVVLEGAYELKLATEQGGTTQKGGHFHADGTHHADH